MALANATPHDKEHVGARRELKGNERKEKRG